MAAKMPNIRYEKRDHYEIFPVSGAFGGPNPKGDSIVCQFYFEYIEPDEKLTLKPIDGSDSSFREDSTTQRKGVRLLQTGIYLTPNQARSIGEWLVRHADEILGIKGEENA